MLESKRKTIGILATVGVFVALVVGVLTVPGPTAALAAGSSVPDASTTGVPDGYPLRTTGSLTITEAGTHLDGLDIQGCLTILADNVWISRVRISCRGGYTAVNQASSARGMLIEDSEILGDGSTATGIWSARDYTVQRSEIAGFHDGLFVVSGTVVSGNWVHSLVQSPGDHNDLIQMVGGNGVRIIGNRLEHVRAQTSAIFIKSDLAPIDDVVIAGNLVTGGAYSIYVMAGNALGGCCDAPTNVSVVNNLIGAGTYLYGQMVVMGSNTVACNLATDGTPGVYVDSDRGTNPRTNPPC